MFLCFKSSDAQNWLTAGNIVGATDFLGATNAANLNFRTVNLQRMTVKGVNNMNPFTNNVGWVGIDNDMPMSKLHIGESNCYSGATCSNGTLAGGWRPWMVNGVFMCQNTDNMYVGMKDEGPDMDDAVISWGDGFGLDQYYTADNLRFIFTEYCLETPSNPTASGPNGLEVMRITPPGLTGIGINFFTSGIQPARRLEVHDANAPQLRLSQSLGTTALYTDFQMISSGQGHLLILPRNDAAGNPDNARIGIGPVFINNNPGAKLDVNSNTTQLRLTRNNGTNFTSFFCNSQGELEITTDAVNRVGIGGDPERNIDVFGDARIRTMSVNNNLSEVVVRDPANGDLFVNTNIGTAASNAWQILGNGNINSAINFMGTTNAVDVVFRTVNQERMRIIGLANIGLGIFEGNVGIGISGPIAKLHAEYTYVPNVTPQTIGFFNFRTNIGTVPGNVYTAVKGQSAITSATTNQVNIGGDFIAQGGNSSFGVKGTVTGLASQPSTNYAVYGEATGNLLFWAGFFNGNLGTTAAGLFQNSDSLLKTNIKEVENALDILNKLSCKTYEYIHDPSINLNLPPGEHYGLLAQDVEAILPNLTAETAPPPFIDTLGKATFSNTTYKSINYIGFIPILIASVQELGKKVEELEHQLTECCSSEFKTSNEDENGVSNQTVVLNGLKQIYLGQNIPNPYSDQTIIPYYIPEEIIRAEIIFFDNLGREIRTVEIVSRGEGQLTALTSGLPDGLYSYSLLADGTLIDTKKMVKQD